eukprot:gene30885-38171_t
MYYTNETESNEKSSGKVLIPSVVSTAPVPVKRGRPAKTAQTSANTTPSNSTYNDNPEKRGRGRPIGATSSSSTTTSASKVHTIAQNHNTSTASSSQFIAGYFPESVVNIQSNDELSSAVKEKSTLSGVAPPTTSKVMALVKPLLPLQHQQQLEQHSNEVSANKGVSVSDEEVEAYNQYLGVGNDRSEKEDESVIEIIPQSVAMEQARNRARPAMTLKGTEKTQFTPPVVSVGLKTSINITSQPSQRKVKQSAGGALTSDRYKEYLQSVRQPPPFTEATRCQVPPHEKRKWRPRSNHVKSDEWSAHHIKREAFDYTVSIDSNTNNNNTSSSSKHSVKAKKQSGPAKLNTLYNQLYASKSSNGTESDVIAAYHRANSSNSNNSFDDTAGGNYTDLISDVSSVVSQNSSSTNSNSSNTNAHKTSRKTERRESLEALRKHMIKRKSHESALEDSDSVDAAQSDEAAAAALVDLKDRYKNYLQSVKQPPPFTEATKCQMPPAEKRKWRPRGNKSVQSSSHMSSNSQTQYNDSGEDFTSSRRFEPLFPELSDDVLVEVEPNPALNTSSNTTSTSTAYTTMSSAEEEEEVEESPPRVTAAKRGGRPPRRHHKQQEQEQGESVSPSPPPADQDTVDTDGDDSGGHELQETAVSSDSDMMVCGVDVAASESEVPVSPIEVDKEVNEVVEEQITEPVLQEVVLEETVVEKVEVTAIEVNKTTTTAAKKKRGRPPKAPTTAPSAVTSSSTRSTAPVTDSEVVETAENEAEKEEIEDMAVVTAPVSVSAANGAKPGGRPANKAEKSVKGVAVAADRVIASSALAPSPTTKSQLIERRKWRPRGGAAAATSARSVSDLDVEPSSTFTSLGEGLSDSALDVVAAEKTMGKPRRKYKAKQQPVGNQEDDEGETVTQDVIVTEVKAAKKRGRPAKFTATTLTAVMSSTAPAVSDDSVKVTEQNSAAPQKEAVPEEVLEYILSPHNKRARLSKMASGEDMSLLVDNSNSNNANTSSSSSVVTEVRSVDFTGNTNYNTNDKTSTFASSLTTNFMSAVSAAYNAVVST